MYIYICLYIYIYMYVYIFIYIYSLNGDNTSNDEIFSQLVSVVAFFKQCIAFMIYI